MPENKLTYIIILNYNAYQDTLECLKSIVNFNSNVKLNNLFNLN